MPFLIINAGGQVESAHETEGEARGQLLERLNNSPEAGPFEVRGVPFGPPPAQGTMNWQTQTPIFLVAGKATEVVVNVPQMGPDEKVTFRIERKTNSRLTSVKPECVFGNVHLYVDTGLGAPLEANGPAPSFVVRARRLKPGPQLVKITSHSTSPAMFFLARI